MIRSLTSKGEWDLPPKTDRTDVALSVCAAVVGVSAVFAFPDKRQAIFDRPLVAASLLALLGLIIFLLSLISIRKGCSGCIVSAVFPISVVILPLSLNLVAPSAAGFYAIVIAAIIGLGCLLVLRARLKSTMNSKDGETGEECR